MKMSTLLLVLVPAVAFAAKPASDLPVTSNLADADSMAVPYAVQSDALGAYQNGVNATVSVLLANGYNHITWGDWRLNLLAGSTREVGISFCDPAQGTTCPANAVQPGDPGYTAPATPPWWGTAWHPVQFDTKCSWDNHDMHAMKPGDTFPCVAIIQLPTVNNTTYELHMGYVNSFTPMPETQELQVTCNAADASGCSDWYVDPIPVVNADGTTSPGRTRARLTKSVTVGGKSTVTNAGDFYLTFHVHVTRP